MLLILLYEKFQIFKFRNILSSVSESNLDSHHILKMHGQAHELSYTYSLNIEILMNLCKYFMMLLSMPMQLLLLLLLLLSQFPLAIGPLCAERAAPNVAHFSFQHEQNCIFKYMANGRRVRGGGGAGSARCKGCKQFFLINKNKTRGK